MHNEKRIFFDLFKDRSPALLVKFSVESNVTPITVPVKNRLNSKIDKNGRAFLESICSNSQLSDFHEFYNAHDGFELFSPNNSRDTVKSSCLKLIPAAELKNFNAQYLIGGKWAWTIDKNQVRKVKDLYRSGDPWLAFAEVDKGPACLTIFLDGENVGRVFYLAPEPGFNILKPIAGTFGLLLERIVKDPPAFLRLVRSYVSIRKPDGNYGHVAVDYLAESGEEPSAIADIEPKEGFFVAIIKKLKQL